MEVFNVNHRHIYCLDKSAVLAIYKNGVRAGIAYMLIIAGGLYITKNVKKKDKTTNGS